MKNLFSLVILSAVSLISFNASAISGSVSVGVGTDSGYYCKISGGEACAASVVHGQCGHYFTRDNYSNPIAACERFVGVRQDTPINRANYYCQSRGSEACAVNSATGQCGQYFQRDNYSNPLRACQMYLGQIPSNDIDKSRYTCQQRGDAVCAVNRNHGQCAPRWTRDDTQDPMRACRNWVGRN